MAEAKVHDDQENALVREADRKKYVSERGPFEIWENPTMVTPVPTEKVNTTKAAAGFEISKLAEKYGEDNVREKVGEMVKAFSPGASSTVLFSQKAPGGMSLVHVWFGADFPLFRHSHPAYGDCLYYVVAGEILLGKKRLGAGSGFFVPNGQPYKYTAGPAGVELLEFRAGGGDKGAPGMQLNELSMDAIQKIIDTSNALQDRWEQPAKIGDTAYRQQELDFG
jgi:hypothetical protein